MDPEFLPGFGIIVPDPAKSERDDKKTVNSRLFVSVVDPYSGASWIRIRIRNTDPDPHMQI